MDTAVISLTEKGRVLSEKIFLKCTDHNIKRYCFHSHCDKNAEAFGDMRELTKNIFGKYDALVFVCAAGIAVRMISPHIVSKVSDPAVIVIGDSGEFVIPILSGHIGRANALSCRIAEILGAKPVITTATDTCAKFSPDSFAAANDLIITDMKAAKAIAAAVLDGKKIGLLSEYECVNIPDDIILDESAEFGICISRSADKKPFLVTLTLVPRNIVLGIGCKRGSPSEKIEKAVLAMLAENKILPERICAAATLDIKSNEEGIISFCRKYGIDLYTFTAEELMGVRGDFSSSDFVKRITGADNICERSAVKCGGVLAAKKYALDGVTAAAAEKNIIIDFERSVL